MFKEYVFEHPGNEVEVAQDMLNSSLDQGLLICLEYACFFSIPEPEYAYKRHAHKKNVADKKVCMFSSSLFYNKVKNSKENHVFDPDIKPFNYYNDKQNNSAKIEPRFSKDLRVNLNQSFAQVPTEIFKYDKHVLNDFTWLQHLDPVFLDNFKNKPTLLWQYFSTENGASKTYPGIK